MIIFGEKAFLKGNILAIKKDVKTSFVTINGVDRKILSKKPGWNAGVFILELDGG